MRRLICIIPSLLLATTLVAQGQGAAPSSGKSPPPTDRKKDLEEAAEKLKKARETMDLEKAREAAEGVLQKLPPKLGDTAKEALEAVENRESMREAAKSAAGALLPEAQKLLKKEQAPTGAPKVEEVPPGPVPGVLQPLPDVAAMSGKNAVTIDSDDTTMDLKKAIFIYTGHVRVRHPQFNIECEELEVHMVKDGEMAAKKPAPTRDPLKPGDAGAQNADNRIKMAIARGPMVTIEKLSETGDIQRGKCKRAVYRGSTGEIVMSDFPQVQRGNMLHIATDPSTEMTFELNGRFHSSGGRQRTVVLPAETAPSGNNSNER